MSKYDALWKHIAARKGVANIGSALPNCKRDPRKRP